MTYLIWEMALYLGATAVLAWLCGWLFTRATWKRKLEDAEVALMGHMHNIQKELDATAGQRAELEEALENERQQNRVDAADLARVQQDLQNANLRHDERKQQNATLTRELEVANDTLNTTREALDHKMGETDSLRKELIQIREQIGRFEDDIEEITQQSLVMKDAFEQARMGIVERDRRIAELESSTEESMQMAAMSGNADPELAISRIGRLQNRVQELFDDNASKEQEISKLKQQLEDAKPKRPSVIERFLASQEDDLQKIEGLGEEHEAILRRLGVKRFADIADWSEKDIEHFDSEIEGHGVIRTQHWVEQAQALRQQTNMKGH